MRFFVNDKSPQGAGHKKRGDDVDIIRDPSDGGEVVVVARYQGKRVCWQCFEPFEHPFDVGNKDVGFEVNEHGLRIALHPRCVDGPPKIIVPTDPVGTIKRLIGK